MPQGRGCDGAFFAGRKFTGEGMLYFSVAVMELLTVVIELL